jgi:hypothetical protein
MIKILIALFLTSACWAQTEAKVDSTTPEVVPAEVVAPIAVVNTPVAVVLPPILFSGDFRYRLQSETQEPKQQRKMQRLQLKLQATAVVHENLKVIIRLMTGTSAYSGNQTLGDEKAPGMLRRNFGLDMGYFDYKAFDFWNLYGGKMPQPLTFVGKNQLILDRDITLEGIATKFKIPFDKQFSFFLQGGMFSIRENYDSLFSEDTSDNMLNVAQTGLNWKENDWDVTLGYGSFGFTGLKDAAPSSLTLGAGSNGNTLDVAGNYPANFDLQEYFFEVKKKLSDVELMAFYELVSNKDIDALNTASSYGAAVGYKGATLTYTQQEVKKDAVVGLFTDSDFAGGQTSSKGSIYSVNYKITSKVQVQYTVYDNKNSIDAVAAKYDRNHIDLMINF